MLQFALIDIVLLRLKAITIYGGEMNKIIIEKGSFKLDEIELGHGSITIGRAEDNDIHLDDPMLSSHHAKITTFFNASHIDDLSSTNGTYINGRQAKTHTLHSGDTIVMGNYKVIFYSDSAAAK